MPACKKNRSQNKNKLSLLKQPLNGKRKNNSLRSLSVESLIETIEILKKDEEFGKYIDQSLNVNSQRSETISPIREKPKDNAQKITSVKTDQFES